MGIFVKLLNLINRSGDMQIGAVLIDKIVILQIAEIMINLNTIKDIILKKWDGFLHYNCLDITRRFGMYLFW